MGFKENLGKRVPQESADLKDCKARVVIPAAKAVGEALDNVARQDGVAGPPGRSGLPGQDGRHGRDGRDGTDGRDGRDGRNGQADGSSYESRWGTSGQREEPSRRYFGDDHRTINVNM
ncbi:hypothetical protein F5Y16DRAFT_402349 [Xylariaceae sp. FL0255]|nr:hypothetical protein F5Y16DRAFT_402349 [Xylariaceae sp. FL0255]